MKVILVWQPGERQPDAVVVVNDGDEHKAEERLKAAAGGLKIITSYGVSTLEEAVAYIEEELKAEEKEEGS